MTKLSNTMTTHINKPALIGLLIALMMLLVSCGGSLQQGYTTQTLETNGFTFTYEHPETADMLKDYDLFITVTDADGKPVDQATVFLDLTMPAMYMPPQQPIAEALGNGRYRVSTLFTMEGEWHVHAHAIINGTTQTVTFNQNVAYQE